MKGIFISYRHAGSGGHVAARIHACLQQRYGPDMLFLDVKSIEQGDDFPRKIDEALAECLALIVVMDGAWFTSGERLSDPEDFVRREIEAALGRDILILPVLVDGASPPRESTLPQTLTALARLQHLPLRHESFDSDMGALIALLDRRHAEIETLRQSMSCPRCRSPIDVSAGKQMTRCPTCNTDVGVLRLVVDAGRPGTSDDARVSRLMHSAAEDVAGENYDNAYDKCEEVLKLQPDRWEAIVNKAICLFWIGPEDLGHLPTVLRLLDRAEVLSNRHPRVQMVRRNVAFNLSVFGTGLDFVGDEIERSLNALDLSRSLLVKDPERDRLIVDYRQRCFKDLRQQLTTLLERERKEFDPPPSMLRAMGRLIRLDSPADDLRFFAAVVEWKLKSTSTSHPAHGPLRRDLEWTLESLKRDSLAPLQIRFSLFGKPRLED